MANQANKQKNLAKLKKLFFFSNVNGSNSFCLKFCFLATSKKDKKTEAEQSFAKSGNNFNFLVRKELFHILHQNAELPRTKQSRKKKKKIT
jgi:hypothetical protein